MSISSALAQAGTGLTAAARQVQVLSGNIANAQTPGYGPRSVALSAAALGGQGAGVRVLGVTRQVDPVLQGLLRGAGAARAQAEVQTRFWAAVVGAIGVPDAPGGLAGALDGFVSALVAAAERPDLDSRLGAAVTAAQGLAQRLNGLERVVQDQRLAADAAIGADARALQDGLDRLHRMNREIVQMRATGQPVLDLEEAREGLLATLSEIVPLRAQVRPEGRMVVYTEGGLPLLDLQPARIGFQPVAAMDAGMTLAGGQLSGLTVNGRAVATGPGGPVAGGRLAAAFALRDAEGPAVQGALDALAASLIARFEGADPTAAPGAPGLFTDPGASPAPGLAGRLAVNPLVIPESGGALWRLRDGLGAAAPGPAGEPAQIGRWLAALDQPLAAGPGMAARSFGQDLDETLSALGQTRQQAEDRLTYAAAVEDGLHQQALAGGVDIDAEMRRLLAVETAYAANARVLSVADAMLRTLLEI